MPDFREQQESNFALMNIGDADFHRLTAFIRERYGIDLRQKRQLITSRLSSTLKQQGYADFHAYVQHLLTEGSEADVNQLLDKLTTNYTFFMRERESFEFFRTSILPELVRRHERDRTLSIWSAGCASGEEPYTISMYIREFLGREADRWDTRLLATDISTDALRKAMAGVYDLPDMVPEKWLRDYFVPDRATGRCTVAPVIRNNVIFRQFNLMEPIRFKRKFDVIFCRNVMIYFDQPTKDALVRRFYDATVSGGYLLISLSENLSPNMPYKRAATSIFRK